MLKLYIQFVISYIFGIKDEALRDKLRKEVIEMALKQEVLELTDFEESAINEGKLESKQETLKNLLIRKFKSISEEISSKIDTCNDIDKLEKAINNIFDYTNSNDVLEFLN